MKNGLHAEDVGWPPKKAVKTINANKNSNIIAVDFSAPEALRAAA